MKELSLEDRLEVLKGTFGFKKVIKFGTSYGITLPRVWVEYYCLKTGDTYWAITEQRKDCLMIRPLKVEDLDGVEIEVKQK